MKRINYLWSLIVTAVAVLSSCSGAPSVNDMLETIPADAAVVGRLNLASVFDNMGMKRDGDTYTMSEDMESIVNGLPGDVQEKFEQVLEALPAIDYENILYYVPAFEDENAVITIGLKKASAVESFLKKEFGAPEKSDGYKIFDLGSDLQGVMKDNFLWLTLNHKRLIKSIKNAKDGENYTANIGPADYLVNSPTLAVVVNLKPVYDMMNPSERATIENYRKNYVCMAATLNGPALTGALTMMNKDDKTTFPGDLFGEINTSVLRYVPENTLFTLAAGKPSREFLDMLDQNTQYRRSADGTKIIDSVDGTSLFALIPPANVRDLMTQNKWNIICVTKMPQDNVNYLVDKTLSSFSYYASVDRVDENMYRIHSPYGSMIGFGGSDIYCGNSDGNYVFSTLPIRTDCNNSFTTAVAGKRVAAAVILPAGNPLLNELKIKFGLSVVANYEDDGCKLTLKLTNTDKKLLETLISLGADERWQRDIVSAVANLTSGSNRGGYDYNSYDAADYDEFIPDEYDWTEEAVEVVEDYDDW